MSVVLHEKQLTQLEDQLKDMLKALTIYRQDPKKGSNEFKKGFAPFAEQFGKLFRDATRTEYQYDDRYTSEQALDRYKSTVSSDWGNQQEEENPITKSEMEDLRAKMEQRAATMQALQDKRVAEKQLAIEQQRKYEEAKALVLKMEGHNVETPKKNNTVVEDARLALRSSAPKKKEYTLDELDDLHSMQKRELDASFDDED